MNIPYKLNNLKSIRQARKENLLGLGEYYEEMLQIAKRLEIELPQAYILSKKAVRKDFMIFKEEKITHMDIHYGAIANLDLSGHEQKVEEKMAWASEIAPFENIYRYLETFSHQIQRAWELERYPSTLSEMLKKDIALRRLIRKEILHYVRTGKTKSADIADLKKLVIAIVLFDPAQEDVLSMLRMNHSGEGSPILRLNALAELLFARIPGAMNHWVKAEPTTIRRKLFSKITRLKITSRHRMTLFGCFPGGLSCDKLPPTLRKIGEISAKMNLPEATKVKLHDYLNALERHILRGPDIYREWFLDLDPDLEIIQKMYVPGRSIAKKVVYSDQVIKTYTYLDTLELYVAKDYLDLCKGLISDDCISDAIGEQHLRTPQYFSIRIFRKNQWIGNIYMLDFTRERSALLVDRIQIPRKIAVFYHRFFEQIIEVFEEMFFDVPYHVILAPMAISNHGVIQNVFNKYRKNLAAMNVSLCAAGKQQFESLEHADRYYVLAEKKKMADRFTNGEDSCGMDACDRMT